MANAFTKTAAIAVAAGLTLAGSAGIATDAIAQETSTTTSNPAPNDSPAAETINDAVAADGTVNLTIHKRANLTGELQSANGEVNPSPSGEPLAGAKFSARKIKGDITDQRVFNQIAKLANDRNIAGITAEGGPGFDGEAIDLGVTQPDGTLTEKLRRGAYLITETAVPTSDDAAYIKSDPFIVFLPMTNAQGDGWNTNVHLYPKNSMAKVTKTVEDADKHAGASKDSNKVVTYTLDGIVPVAPEDNELTAFNINDSYNSAELQLGANFLQSVEVVRGETRTVLDPADYTVTSSGETAGKNNTTKSADGKTDRDYNAGFVISLTKTGLSKVQANDHVVATVKATLLNAQEGGDQDIWNSVNETGTFKRKQGTGSGFEENPWETPHDEVVTYLGNIEVLKAGEKNDGSREPLQGAEFKIGKCNDEGTAIVGDPIQTGTTDNDGKLLFEGLHVTDVINNVPVAKPGKYCLQETKAPAGYSFDKNKVYPIELEKDTRNATQPANFLEKGQTGNSAAYAETENGTIRMNGVAINNVKSSTPTLPSTGGMGVLIIVLAGLAIIGGGVYAARRNSQSA